MGEAELLGLVIALVALALGLGGGAILWAEPLGRVRGEAARATAAAAALDAKVREMEPLKSLHAAASAAAAEAGQRIAAMEAAAAEREVAHREKVEALLTTGDALKAEFERLAAEALKRSQTQFLEVAGQTIAAQREAAAKEFEANKTALAGLLTPVSETLGRYQEGLKAIEEKREQAYGSLREQLGAVAQGQGLVQAEAQRLATALRSSGRVAGSWGESQLRNVLELAGLRAGIDFTLQASTEGDDGRKRPDAVIRLPGGRELVVDSKCSLADYLNAAAADDEGRRALLLRHAASVRSHAQGLSQKAYWNEFAASADFVVMFLPGENYLAAALEQDTGLLDWAFQNRILLAGPINLLAIAKTVALVWRQETVAQEAREIGRLGAELYKSLADMGEHVGGLGKNLRQAVDGYNQFVGSLERNVLPKARRFAALGVESGKKAVPELAPLDTEPRPLVAQELLLVPPGVGAAE